MVPVPPPHHSVAQSDRLEVPAPQPPAEAPPPLSTPGPLEAVGRAVMSAVKAFVDLCVEIDRGAEPPDRTEKKVA